MCGGTMVGAVKPRRAQGSIPACAGEPATAQNVEGLVKVYPRVCGGTGPAGRVSGLGLGLSPRVRGNLTYPIPSPRENRSIPACAGEPLGLLIAQLLSYLPRG